MSFTVRALDVDSAENPRIQGDKIFAAGHQVRLVRLPFRTEPIEVALYTRHESSRNPSQRWLIGFMADILGTPVCPAQLPPLTSRSA